MTASSGRMPERGGILAHAANRPTSTARAFEVLHRPGWIVAVILALIASLGCQARPTKRAIPSGGGRSGVASADTSLKDAIDVHDVAAVKRALDAGADPNALVPPEQPVLVRAVLKGDVSILRMLLAAGANPNGDPRVPHIQPLSSASLEGVHPDVVTELLRAGANPNAPSEGMSPLGIAAFRGNGAACFVLVKGGAHVNGWNLWPPPPGHPRLNAEPTPGRGRTALMLAAARGHDGVVQMLLRLGADPSLKNDKGQTALALSAEYECPIDSIRTLLQVPRAPSR